MAGARLDRMIAIERFTGTKSPLGGTKKTWPEYMKAWASVTPVSDGERFRADAASATITDRFVINWNAKAALITVKDRISYGGRYYDIHGIKEIGRRHRLEISATAVAK
ncbi:MAG: hypothetical protein COA53_06435 [Rhodobacteraceae bacterium]|nr:MAG: hypothetical protein COA53_06435 [Paracoccaceae bacterium]